jgi:integrase/recombinase XerD
MTPLRQRMLDELRLRNYADNTALRYLDAVTSFARHFHKSPDRMGREQIREYLLHLVKDRNSAPNTVQIHRAALRFLYVKTLGRQWFDEQIARTRRREGLPTVLSAEEITRILDCTTNLKHWTMIATFYATGLRANELRNLKVSDLDSRRMVIHVRISKGGVPRDIGLSPVLLERLKVYWRRLRPKDWLFPSAMRPDQQLEPKSIRHAISKAARRGAPGLTSTSARMSSGTAARRTCSKPAPISAPFRCCSATRIFKRPPAICVFQQKGCRLYRVRSTRLR